MAQPGVLFYDEDCGFCTRTARWVARGSRGRVRIAPLTSAEAKAALAHVPPAERWDRAWLLQEGQLYCGHEAIWHALYAMPGGGLLRPLRWVPGFQPVCRWVYRWVADHRSPTCRLRDGAVRP
jgi:predicted DCC family thiol-disulfide oxidoreductase YuxK